jgi:hypothetical protein
MSPFANPKLAAIDDALTELEPSLNEFAQAHGFALTRSHEGSFNAPRRWLHRDSGVIRHEIGLIVSSKMPERLERGFYPDIPCTLYFAAFDRKAQMHYETIVFEAQPFISLRDSLPRHLADALAKLDACTPDFISRYGVQNAAF